MKTVLFVCVHNAGRSQMAEAFVNHMGKRVRGESAGTIGGTVLNPVAVQVMAEFGISMDSQSPKLLTQEQANAADRIITMGCGVDAEACPAKFLVTEDWGLDDPAGQPIEKVREIRDQIRARVESLLAEMDFLIRRYAAEFLGTFAIVLFGCGTIISLNGLGGAAHLTINLVFGLVVGAMVFALGPISAAHFNPAVTLAFAVTKRFPVRYILPYLVSQIAGALLASWVLLILLPDLSRQTSLGSTIPKIDMGRAVGAEAIITFFLMLVIMAVATNKQTNGAVPGLAIGGTVAACGLFAGPITGCSMNPARSLGPALLSGNMQWWPVFVIGPCLGAMLAAAVYEAIRLNAAESQGAPAGI